MGNLSGVLYVIRLVHNCINCFGVYSQTDQGWETVKTIYVKTFIVYLLMAILISACSLGQHPNPDTGKPVAADFDDVVSWVFGWNSWEELQVGGPMLISISDDSDQSQIVLAYPSEPVLAGTVVNDWLRCGQASIIGDGEAYAARLQTSAYAIREAFANAPLTQRFIDPTGRFVVALKPYGTEWYYGFVDLTKKSMFTICKEMNGCGAFANAKSISEIVDTLKANGWKSIPASAIPAAVRTVLLFRLSALQSAWFIRLSGTVSSPIFVFGSMLNVPYKILVPDSSLIEDVPQN